MSRRFSARGGALMLAVGLVMLMAIAPAQAATRLAASKVSPVAHPARGQLRLYVDRVFTVMGNPVTVSGRSVEVTGVMRPYRRGQVVTVWATVDGRLISRVRRHVLRSKGGSYGFFRYWVTSPRVGQVYVTVKHAANASIARLRTTTNFAALNENVSFGNTGRFVVLLQQRLAALHFYIPQTGVYDYGTGLALDAYHRLLRWGTSQNVDHNTVMALLDGYGSFPIRYPGDGKHAEGNLGLQVLALIDHGQVLSLYPISSGKPSTPTILGRFHVYEKTPGYLPDGMYYSSFFYGGYAIHGYDPAPDYPASHGCMRLPIVDATSVYGWLNYGDGVDVYY